VYTLRGTQHSGTFVHQLPSGGFLAGTFLSLVSLLLPLFCCSSNPSIVLNCFVSADLLFVLSILFNSCHIFQFQICLSVPASTLFYQMRDLFQLEIRNPLESNCILEICWNPIANWNPMGNIQNALTYFDLSEIVNANYTATRMYACMNIISTVTKCQFSYQ